jgi:hypothetical protein
MAIEKTAIFPQIYMQIERLPMPLLPSFWQRMNREGQGKKSVMELSSFSLLIDLNAKKRNK